MTCVNEIKISVLVVICCKSNSSGFAQILFSPNNAVCVNCTWAIVAAPLDLDTNPLFFHPSLALSPCLLVFPVFFVVKFWL